MRQFHLAIVAAGFCLAAAPALAQSVDAYDDSWYRAPFWSGEYPGGFSVLKDTIVKLRLALSPPAEKTIDCPLPAKATYQQWNMERVEAEGLTFISFTEIDEMEITKAYDTTLYRNDDATAVEVSFKPGDTWRYLAYFAEGAFLMEYDGVKYDGDQDLFDVSKQIAPGPRGYDQWLRINCSNNQWGWLFLNDIVQDDVTFTGPNIVEYGRAADLD
jgi:hypothetical protein